MIGRNGDLVDGLTRRLQRMDSWATGNRKTSSILACWRCFAANKQLGPTAFRARLVPTPRSVAAAGEPRCGWTTAHCSGRKVHAASRAHIRSRVPELTDRLSAESPEPQQHRNTKLSHRRANASSRYPVPFPKKSTRWSCRLVQWGSHGRECESRVSCALWPDFAGP
jgi:hypothetical protein